MARLPRFVIPGQPRHIIQRGHNRQALFGADADYRFFREALVEAAAGFGYPCRCLDDQPHPRVGNAGKWARDQPGLSIGGPAIRAIF